jgi:hypothetical protein
MSHRLSPLVEDAMPSPTLGARLSAALTLSLMGALLGPAAGARAQPFAATPIALPLRVMSTSPPAESMAFLPGGNVSVTFNMPIDPATLNLATFSVTGKWSGPVPGQLVLSNKGRTVTFVRERDYSAGESVTVSLSTGLRGRFGVFTGRGHWQTFWVRPKAAGMAFVEVGTLTPGSVPYGAFGGDLDDDGRLDLAIPNEESSNVSVFLNQGDGSYKGPANFGVGFHCSPNEGVDLDGDGVVDLAVANILDHNVSILMGKGDGTFEPQVKYAVGSQPRGLAAFDVDGDGDIDLITANRSSGTMSLLRNRGDGTFDGAATFDAGLGGETGVAPADMNRDGATDLVVIGYYSDDVAVLLGNGKGGFSISAIVPCGPGPWQVAAGDINGDGRPDVALACSFADQAGVLMGDGAGGVGAFKGYAAPDFPIAIDIADADGDGDLDMGASSYGGAAFTLYRNLGGGTFEKALQLPADGAGSCMVFHDRDGDGIVDLTGIDEGADRVFLFRQ